LTEKKTIGSYTLAEQIGEGGMATIYKAKHEILNRDVAIKKLKSPSKEATSRFHKEARLSAKLNHENVVSIYDFVKAGPAHPWRRRYRGASQTKPRHGSRLAPGRRPIRAHRLAGGRSLVA
jgi:hypothetical protein